MNDSGRHRLTSSGTSVVVGSAILSTVGFITGYRELVVLAVAGLLVIIAALLLPRMATSVTLTRVAVPALVERGTALRITIKVQADTTAPPLRIIDILDGSSVSIDLPETSPNDPTFVTYTIRARRRGPHQLGPIHEDRADPFTLATRTVRHDVVDEILVHPHIHRLTLRERGDNIRRHRAAAPRISQDPLSDFRSLREYTAGDDTRLIHWASTAKAGTVMVRDYVELRRASRVVVLDTIEASTTEQQFEDAVEIAASIVCASLAENLAVIARTSDRSHPGRTSPLRGQREALELFARVGRTTEADSLSTPQLDLARQPGDQLVLVAGSRSRFIRQMVSRPRLAHRLMVIRLDDGSAPMHPLSVRHLDVRSSEEFALRWRSSLAR